jgi:hypothetical protein
MTIGAWLNTVILEQSESSQEPQLNRNLRSRPSSPADDTKARFDDLADQLSELSRQDQQATAGRHHGEATLSREFNRILERIDSTERSLCSSQ